MKLYVANDISQMRTNSCGSRYFLTASPDFSSSRCCFALFMVWVDLYWILDLTPEFSPKKKTLKRLMSDKQRTYVWHNANAYYRIRILREILINNNNKIFYYSNHAWIMAIYYKCNQVCEFVHNLFLLRTFVFQFIVHILVHDSF